MNSYILFVECSVYVAVLTELSLLPGFNILAYISFLNCNNKLNTFRIKLGISENQLGLRSDGRRPEQRNPKSAALRWSK